MSADPTPAAGVGFRSERGPVLLALMLSTSLVALDSTVIATAVPTIVRDLGGFAQFPWLLSVYLLAQAVSTPIYGKFADIVGRKPVMLVGVGMFLLGSVLCGAAWSMPALIVFRAVQGLGAGAILPVSMTVVGDIYTLAERARVQGYLASVWGASSVVGPLVGGVFAQFVSWRWIFFVNVPLCLVAGWMLWRDLHEELTPTRHRIDFPGAVLLAGGTALVVLGLLEGGVAWAWGSVPSLVVFVVGAAALAGFVAVERRAPEPILPLWVFTRRTLVTTSVASLLVGVVVIGLTSYVPTFVQVGLGTGALVAGFSVATLTMGWPVAASQAGRVYLRYGFRASGLLGSSIAVAGTVLTLFLGGSSRPWQVAGACLVIGVGMGFCAVPTLIAAQTTVGWSERGVVTSTNMFARTIGSAVGAAVFGAVVNSALGPHSEHPAPAELVPAVHLVFVGLTLAAVALTVAVAAMPGRAHEGAPTG